LGIKIFNLPFSWPSEAPPKKKKSIFQENKSAQLSAAVDENGIIQAWKKILEDNIKIPVNNKCKLPNTSIAINTADTTPLI
jgi:hypothetical protein